MRATEISPARPRRLRRFAGRFLRAFLIFVVAIAALDGIATVIFGRRYEAELNKIKQRGEPVTMADLAKLAGEPVPDSENAAIVYQRIFKKLKGPAADKLVEALDEINPEDKREKTPKVWAAAEAAARQFDPIVPMAEQAAAMPMCLFHVNWEAGCQVDLHHYAQLRYLARVLANKSVVYAHNGQTEKALHCAELALGLGERINRDPTVISILVRMALINFSSRATAEIVRQCPINEAQAKHLFEVLGAINLAPQFRSAWFGERALGIWAIDRAYKVGYLRLFDQGPPDEDVLRRFETKAVAVLDRPLVYADGAAYIPFMSDEIRRTSMPYRELKEGCADSRIENLPSYRILTRMLALLLPGVTMRTDKCLAELSVTRAGLALVAYKDRFGSYPASLDEMTKKLGWARLPEDPFSGKALVYKRQGKGFVVYSIGPNLKDDGGVPTGRHENETEKGDIVISRSL